MWLAVLSKFHSEWVCWCDSPNGKDTMPLLTFRKRLERGSESAARNEAVTLMCSRHHQCLRVYDGVFCFVFYTQIIIIVCDYNSVQLLKDFLMM